ncbi:MAG: hypothetical protein ACE5ET_01660 [Gammaproteobacteria bacterium]
MKSQPLLGALLLMMVFMLSAGWLPLAQAHKGHGGAMVTFLKKKATLRAMLPEGAKVVKRKQRLSEEADEWAAKTYDVDLDESLYTYYLAKDRSSGKIIGGAIITKATYRHGDIMIAVGLDAAGKVTRVALTAISEKYIPDFEGTVGKGFLDRYTGMTLADLVQNAKEQENAGKPERLFASKLRDAAVLLVAFMHSAK